MNQSKRYIYFGIILNSIAILLNRIQVIPEFIRGMCVGLALFFLFMGCYYQNHDTPRLIRYKKQLWNKLRHPAKRV